LFYILQNFINFSLDYNVFTGEKMRDNSEKSYTTSKMVGYYICLGKLIINASSMFVVTFKGLMNINF
jgi:hypothetical protein